MRVYSYCHIQLKLLVSILYSTSFKIYPLTHENSCMCRFYTIWSLKYANCTYTSPCSTQLSILASTSVRIWTGKSCKLIPVIWTGFLTRGESFGIQETAYILLITVGMNLYLRGGPPVSASDESTSVYGLVLLFLSLVLDGFTTATQDQLQAAYQLTTHELMFFLNFWGCILLFVLAVISGQGNEGVAYCTENPFVIWYIQIVAIASALGQNFVFYMISNVNTLTLSTVTTSRLICDHCMIYLLINLWFDHFNS